MKIPTHIEAACSTDETRENLRHPILTKNAKGEPMLLATDGRIIAFVPCKPDEGDVDGMIPVDALKISRSIHGKTVVLDDEGELVETKRDVHLGLGQTHANLGNGLTVARNPAIKPPNWQVLTEGQPEPSAWICFNVDLLVKLSKAIGTNAIALGFSPGVALMRVRPCLGGSSLGDIGKEDGPHGYLMPIRADKAKTHDQLPAETKL